MKGYELTSLFPLSFHLSLVSFKERSESNDYGYKNCEILREQTIIEEYTVHVEFNFAVFSFGNNLQIVIFK